MLEPANRCDGAEPANAGQTEEIEGAGEDNEAGREELERGLCARKRGGDGRAKKGDGDRVEEVVVGGGLPDFEPLGRQVAFEGVGAKGAHRDAERCQYRSDCQPTTRHPASKRIPTTRLRRR